MLTYYRYDLLHNAHLNLEGLDELFIVAQVFSNMFDKMMPNSKDYWIWSEMRENEIEIVEGEMRKSQLSTRGMIYL